MRGTHPSSGGIRPTVKAIVAGIIGLVALGLTGCSNDCSEAAERMRTCCANASDMKVKSLCERVAQALEDAGEDCDPDQVVCDVD